MDNHICHFSFSNKSGHHYYEDNTRPCNKTKVTEVICLTLKCIFKNIFKSIQSFTIGWGLLLRLSILFSSLLFQSFLTESKKIKELRLYSSPLSPNTLQMITNALSINTTMKSLWISNDDNITDNDLPHMLYYIH